MMISKCKPPKREMKAVETEYLLREKQHVVRKTIYIYIFIKYVYIYIYIL